MAYNISIITFHLSFPALSSLLSPHTYIASSSRLSYLKQNPCMKYYIHTEMWFRGDSGTPALIRTFLCSSHLYGHLALTAFNCKRIQQALCNLLPSEVIFYSSGPDGYHFHTWCLSVWKTKHASTINQNIGQRYMCLGG